VTTWGEGQWLRIETERDWTIGIGMLTGVLIESTAIHWSERSGTLTGTALVPEQAETPSYLRCLREQIAAR
jgi:hypothetical protein